MADGDSDDGGITRIPLQDFANEVQRDLPRLIKECPSGIFLSDIAKEYGESVARIKGVIHILLGRHVITEHQTSSNAYYIVPTGYTLQIPLPNLTDLQRGICLLLLRVCAKYQTNRVQTNYAWMARQLQASSGGVQTAIRRLSQLQYLTIEEPSIRGQNDGLILKLSPNLLNLNLTP